MSGRCGTAQLASIREMTRQLSRGSAWEYQEDERAGAFKNNATTFFIGIVYFAKKRAIAVFVISPQKECYGQYCFFHKSHPTKNIFRLYYVKFKILFLSIKIIRLFH